MLYAARSEVGARGPCGVQGRRPLIPCSMPTVISCNRSRLVGLSAMNFTLLSKLAMLGIKAPDPHVEQVFTELVDTYQTSLLRMCYLNLQDIGLAEDAVQETFIKAYRALSSFRNESNLKTWLMKTAINTCRDMQRGSWWKHINRAVTLDRLNSAIPPVSDDVISLNMEIANSFPGQRLLIVNTVQSATVIAKTIMQLYGRNRVEHLSTALTARDRARTLARVRQRLRDPSDCDWTLVATSCVEAGVDFSFSVGFRETASLSSLLQASQKRSRTSVYP